MARPPTRVELWRYRQLFRIDGKTKFGFAVLIVVFMYLGAVAGLVVGARLRLSGSALLVAMGLASLVGLIAALLRASSLLRAGIVETAEGQMLNDFDGIASRNLIFRLATAPDIDPLLASLDEVVRDANGMAPDADESYRHRLEHDVFRKLRPYLAIEAATSGEIVGFAVFNGERSDGSPEAGFWLAAAARGQGFGPEIVVALGQIASRAGHRDLWSGRGKRTRR